MICQVRSRLLQLISADESDVYDLLHTHFPVRLVNHRQAYRADNGTTHKQTESYFSQLSTLPVLGALQMQLLWGNAGLSTVGYDRHIGPRRHESI